MKILVTGGSGQLGYDVCWELERRRIEYTAPSSKEMDITDANAVREQINAYRPDAVIHCAAWTAVDAAEDDPEQVFAVNEGGTRNIALACREIGAKMLYISTDYVFPGTGTHFYEPDDPVGPVNVYGKSKLAGELAVKEILEKYFIVRISWVFGEHGNNFVKTMLRLAETRTEISVACDQVGSPTYTIDLAPLLCDMVVTEKYGTYHATNEGTCSWAEFAEAIFQFAEKDVKVNYIATREYSTKAIRPLNSRLSKDCLSNAAFTRLPHWKKSLYPFVMHLSFLKKMRENFALLQDKKIMLYGTGVIARKLVKSLEGFQIVGCLDRYRVEGDVEGIPIITWDDIADGTADALIIASLAKNYREIYDRIIYRCIGLHLEVYSGIGENLREKHFFSPVKPETVGYYLKNKNELKKAIEEHDAVSFDLFDTLIMRRALEPIDVFNIVEERLKEKGIVIPRFKKKRQAAEYRTPNGNIYQIYETLGNMLGLDQTATETILREEIQCEKDCLIPRNVMAELFQYAVSLGKIVNILTDMYLPAPIIEDILSDLGIEGYRNIYVSCDYGVGKGNGLFPIYLESVRGLRCLHIGDNRAADIESAARCGIDTYYIKSACEMLRISNLRRILVYEGNKCDRLWIGLLISELFNDPFALYHSSGVVTVKDAEIVGKLFFAPIVLVYMQKLYDTLKAKDYDGVLFGARDGYLFKKIYDDGVIEPPSVPSIYLLISRKLALKATRQTEKDIIELKEMLQSYKNSTIENLRNTFRKIFGKQSLTDVAGQSGFDYSFIIAESEKTKKDYLAYLKNIGIDLDKNYLFCDFVSGGTCHRAVNRIFNHTQDSFFLCRLMSPWYLTEEVRIPYYSVYSKEEWRGLSGADTSFLEIVITAPTPSICDMSEGGTPVYALDHRDQTALRMINMAQEGIIDFIHQYRKICRGEETVSKELVRDLLDMIHDVNFKEDADIINQIGLIDDIIEENFDFQS